MSRYVLTRGTHRRIEDGKQVVYVAGTDHAVFEPTPQELKAFSDRLRPCTEAGDPVEPGVATGLYRLKIGKHQRYEDGVLKTYKAGDELKLSENELAAFRDRFDPVFGDAKKATDGELELLKGNAKQVIENIASIDIPETLQLLLEQEHAGGKRKTVIEAISARLEDLSPV